MRETFFFPRFQYLQQKRNYYIKTYKRHSHHSDDGQRIFKMPLFDVYNIGIWPPLLIYWTMECEYFMPLSIIILTHASNALCIACSIILRLTFYYYLSVVIKKNCAPLTVHRAHAVQKIKAHKKYSQFPEGFFLSPFLLLFPFSIYSNF